MTSQKKKTLIAATCSVHAQGAHVRARLTAPNAPTATPLQKRHHHAALAAATYRLAAEVELLNADDGASIAISVDPRSGTLTLEMAEGTDVTVVQCLMGDALQALKISAAWMPLSA